MDLRESNPLVEFVAGGIGDPVIRLRFLKMIAPVPKPRSRWRYTSLATSVCLAAMLGGGLLLRVGARPKLPPQRATVAPASPSPPAATPSARVWLVEQSAASESYSNGLRIDDRFVVTNHPRRYLLFREGGPEARSQPAGIVFHTTESRQAPFEPSANQLLRRLGGSVIDYVQRKRAYHFLIDRFGRVYRIVAEADAANHAGFSVWAGPAGAYLNLNESFLGVSFEADTHPGQIETSVSPAQIRAAAMLVEMLRSRYEIPAENCVAHSQVSVNPSNMRVGYHTDWASSFPFEQLGLPNSYARPAPAVELFGFEYDSRFLHWAGTPLFAGVQSAESKVEAEARSRSLSVPAYRKRLQDRYRRLLAEVGQANRTAMEGY